MMRNVTNVVIATNPKTEYKINTCTGFDQPVNSLGETPCATDIFDGEALSLRCRDLGLRDNWTGDEALWAFNRNSSRRSMSFLAFLAALDGGESIPDAWYLFSQSNGRVVLVRLCDGGLNLHMSDAGSGWPARGNLVFPSVRK
jgi:hypothetical protein